MWYSELSTNIPPNARYSMQVIHCTLPEILLFDPTVIGDHRGYFFESWNRLKYSRLGMREEFVQDNISMSKKGTVRGLHYQWPYPQAKFLQVLEGEIIDVAVDVRRNSPTFGKWVKVNLSSENHRQLYIPAGFAHGFCVLSERAMIMYKCSDYYHPGYDRGVLWNDPEIGVDWPIADPVLSQRDKSLQVLSEIPPELLPEL